MCEDKKYTLDKETLETHIEKLNNLIAGDNEAIKENDAIAKDPNHVFDSQGEWADDRKKIMLRL